MTHDPKEVQELSNKLVALFDGCSLDTAMTVLCNVTGQVVAHRCGGAPAKATAMAKDVGDAVRLAAMGKLAYDDAQRRNKQ